MKAIQLYFILAILSVLSFRSSAQVNDSTIEHKLSVLTRFTGSAIEIRWAPTSKQLWGIASKKGFVIERRSSDNETWKTLGVLKPYSLEQWKTLSDTTNVYVATAAQALLGANTISFKDVKTIQEAQRLAEEQDAMFAFGLLSADYNKQAALGLALRYDDTDIIKGKAYTYRLFINDFTSLPEFSIKNDTLIFTVLTNVVPKMPQVKNVYADPSDGEILIKWDRQFNDRFFSGYWIEKSSDNGKTYKRLNDLPHSTSKSLGDGAEHVFRDTQVVNYKKYKYKIIGLTPFAVDGLPSEEVITEGIDLSGPMPPMKVKARDAGNGSIIIEWEAEVNTSDHAGFLIERALNAIGPYELITPKVLSKNARSFIDKSPTPVVANYYIVYATDDKGNRNGSAPIVIQWVDTIPPAKPQNLDGIIDSNGIVTLTWDLGLEPDLLGYRVFFSNAREREFFQLTTEILKGNIFFDSVTLNTLTRNVYYYVVALDRNYNPSEWSDILELTMPDIIPPQAPVLFSYTSEDEGVALKWRPSTSSDVSTHSVWRKISEEEEWAELTSASATDSVFLDDTVEKGKRYTYAVTATDAAGLISPYSNFFHVDAVDRGNRKGIGELKAKFDKIEKAIKLEWSFDGDSDARFLLMRNDNQEGFSPLTNLAANILEYFDKSLYRNEKGFEYIIKVLYPDGGESIPSNKVIIQF